MVSIVFTFLGSAILFVLYLALAAILLRKYKSTGDTGFLWLGAAVVLWPILSNVLNQAADFLIRHSAHGHPSAANPSSSFVTVLTFLEQAIGIGLVMVAVYVLAKAREKFEPSASVENDSKPANTIPD
jgi:ABC-type polysaccharide/polyol phosphate export permease